VATRSRVWRDALLFAWWDPIRMSWVSRSTKRWAFCQPMASRSTRIGLRLIASEMENKIVPGKVTPLRPKRPCPECGEPSERAHFPFCSPRCKDRSEEHTSELQSRENLVCRLLL